MIYEGDKCVSARLPITVNINVSYHKWLMEVVDENGHDCYLFLLKITIIKILSNLNHNIY